MRLLLVLAIACLALLTALPASAYTITFSAGNTTTTPGAVTFATFDPPTPVDTSIATVAGGTICPGSCSGPVNPTGSSAYLFVRDSTATITFPSLQSYFGLFWGTPDVHNLLSFFRDATQIGGSAFSGASLQTGFVNFTAQTSAELFNRVEITDGSCCFEVDNLAALQPTQVPEPSALGLLLAGLGASASFVRRRLLR